MKKVVEYLDKVASSLEQKGLLREAEEIDIISNTIEAMDKEAAVVAENTAVIKQLNNMLKNPRDAYTLASGFKNIEDSKIYPALSALNNDSIKASLAAFNEAKKMFDNFKVNKDVNTLGQIGPILQEAHTNFMAAKPVIDAYYKEQGGALVGQTGLRTFSTNPNVGKSQENKPDVQNPAYKVRGNI